MAKQYKNGKCSCWAKVDRELQKHGCKLSTGFSFDGHNYLSVETYRVQAETRRRVVAPKKVYASFCPFCGGKLK
jgi:hypothetical protein